jgi:hypothetical protein
MRENVSPQRGTNTQNNPQTRDANAAQRVALAVKLRSTKMTYEAIARQCGYSNASACRKAVMRELDRCVVKNVDELRTEELESLELLERECWRIFADKNREKSQLFAVDRILAIKDRRAKLMGLDTPIGKETATTTVVIREVPPGYFGGQK